MSIYSMSAREYLVKQTPETCTLDVRTVAEMRSSHLANTFNIPLQDLTAERLLKKLAQCNAQPKAIYLLCQGGKRAEAAAKLLEGKLDADLFIIEGGVNALRAAKAPLIDAPKAHMSIDRQVRITAGSLILIGVLLGWFIAPAFIWLSGFVGAGLVFAGVTDSCMMASLLARAPWNK